jgi:serine protease AprX
MKKLSVLLLSALILVFSACQTARTQSSAIQSGGSANPKTAEATVDCPNTMENQDPGAAPEGADSPAPQNTTQASEDATDEEKLAGEREAVFGNIDENKGVSGMDLKDKDLSKASFEMLSGVNFDSNTVWPGKANLPASFSPAKWLDACKDPGLGMEELHKQGITGKGVSVAVFDKPIKSTHAEYGKRLVYTPVGILGDFHFHGQACASVIAGKTCGVAPKAKLYYFAVPDNGENFDNYCKAMDELIALNKTLPKNGKIRLVSISDGLIEEGTRWENWNAALSKAKAAGIAVNYSNSLGSGNRFAEGGCPPYKDKSDPDNYVCRYKEAKNRPGGPAVIIPGDYRTTAENESNDTYRYYYQGGFSWTIAYVSGLSALAYQVDSQITYDEILNLLYDTATINANGYAVANPAGFIEAVKNKKK